LLLHEALGDGESQPRALLRVCITALDLAEFLKNKLLIFGTNANSCVAHRDANRIPLLVTVNVNSALFGGKFHSIAEQVVENLLKAHTIGIDGEIGFQSVLERDLFCHSQRTDGRKNLRQRLVDWEALAMKFNQPGFNFGKIQDVID
jgi:hypothetical protein